MMRKRIGVTAVVMGILVCAQSMTVLAAGDYSYLSGRERSTARNAAYAQAETMGSEEEREAFLKEQGIGETEWSEDAASAYSYVEGQKRGASYASDDDDDQEIKSSYSYVTGQQRGSGYHKS